jgi:hypothetical protein
MGLVTSVDDPPHFHHAQLHDSAGQLFDQGEGCNWPAFL